MHCSRLLAALAAAMSLVVYSGCGGEEKKDSSQDGPGKKPQAAAGDKAPAAASAPSAGQGGVADSLTAAAGKDSAIDVSLVTPSHFAAIVFHPRRIVHSPLVAELMKDEAVAEGVKKFGIDPGEVEQVVALLSMDEQRKGPQEPFALVIAQFTHDVDAKEVLAKLQAAMHHPAPIKEIEVGGKTCFDLGTPDAPLACAVGRNSIALQFGTGNSAKEIHECARRNLEKVLASAGPSGPLAERLKKIGPDNDAILAVEPESIPDFQKLMDEAKRGAPVDVDALKSLRGGTLIFSLTAPAIVHAVLDAKDAEAAGNVEDLLQQLARMAGGGLAVAKQGMPKEAKAAVGPLLKLAEEFIDGVKTTKSGSQLTLDVKRPRRSTAARRRSSMRSDRALPKPVPTPAGWRK